MTNERDEPVNNYALATNLAFEAYAVSGGERNVPYAVARAIRLRGLREIKIRAPFRDAPKSKEVGYVFTDEERTLLDRALNQNYPSRIRHAIEAEERSEGFYREHAEDFDDPTQAEFEKSWREDSAGRRENYMARTKPMREAEENALGYKRAQLVERWTGCVCFGSGYVWVSDGETESAKDGGRVRKRCEVCQGVARRERLDRDARGAAR